MVTSKLDNDSVRSKNSLNPTIETQIKLLSADVINQIAAGEVVERPAHLVKELIENSIDAKANQIFIDVALGGRFIKISDNGLGISKDDLELALIRHATSKISDTEDLYKLQSFGFRGEALASISAVSKLTLMSRFHLNEMAYQIKSEFGQISSIFESSLNQGTQILIESLFENIPARLKFLKTDSTEVAQIRLVLKAMSLVNPHVEFKLTVDGKLDLFYKVHHVESDIKRAQEILGLKKIFTATYQGKGYKAQAFYSSPQETQKMSKNIWIFAQKRWIQDRALQAAVMDSYRSLLMHGEYPQVMIDLTCDTDLIDVNIHPTKSQVKFQNSSEAYRVVHHAIRDGLEKAPWIYGNENFNQPAQNYSESIKSDKSNPLNNQAHQTFLNDQSFQKIQYKTKDFKLDNPISNQLSEIEVSYKNQLLNLKVNSENVSSDHKGLTIDPKNIFWSNLQVIGQLNLTYIVCQQNDRLVLVDQHAAHERVAFEKLMSKWKGGSIEKQDYLFPLALDLSVEKIEALKFIEADIQRMGFEFEILGPSVFGITSAPHFIKESSLPHVFNKLGQDLIEFGGSYNLENSIADLFASLACHSVVRAGQSLSSEEMKELLIAMDEFPLSSFCPHGRPVMIEMSFNEIEKKFGRIV